MKCGAWEGLIGPYLEGRNALKGVVLIMDARHPLDRTRCATDRMVCPIEKPIHILLTKADKLTRVQQAQTLRDVRPRWRNWEQYSVQLFSSPQENRHRSRRSGDREMAGHCAGRKPVVAVKRQLAPGKSEIPNWRHRLAARKLARKAAKESPGKGGTGAKMP